MQLEQLTFEEASEKSKLEKTPRYTQNRHYTSGQKQ